MQINTTVTGHNLTDLPEIVRIVHEMGALTWSAFLLVPTGRGRLLPGLDAHQVEDVLNFVYDAGGTFPPGRRRRTTSAGSSSSGRSCGGTAKTTSPRSAWARSTPTCGTG